MRVDKLTGQDLAYWVSRANDPTDANRLRRHYGDGPSQHDKIVEPHMREFVVKNFGQELPDRASWQ